VNHVAFEARSEEELALHRARWLEHGASVTEVDHGFCRSIYTMDPNGILVEFCVTTRAFTAEDVAEAERLLGDSAPALEPPPPVTLHRPGRPQ
jgi:catechol-2,3-dioxygenase